MKINTIIDEFHCDISSENLFKSRHFFFIFINSLFQVASSSKIINKFLPKMCFSMCRMGKKILFANLLSPKKYQRSERGSGNLRGSRHVYQHSENDICTPKNRKHMRAKRRKKEACFA